MGKQYGAYNDADDDDDLDDDGPQGPAQLRKALRAQQRENRRLTERLEQLEKGQRGSHVDEALRNRNLPSKIAGMVPENLTSKQDIDAWFTQWGDVLGAQPSQGGGDGQQAPAVDQQTVDTIDGIEDTMAGGAAPEGMHAEIERVRGMSREQLLDAISKAQGAG